MRRREFVSILGGAAAWPFAARAQQPGIPVIGFLCSGSSVTDGSRIASVQKGLKESGYVEGQNLVIEYRWAEERYDRLTALARDLAQRPVDLIAAIGTTPAAVAAKTATTVVPIVFVIGTDPVKLGLVVSLNRPAGNLTGVSFLNRVIVAKQFALLHEAVPKATVSGFLVNPTNPYADSDTSDAQAACTLVLLHLRTAAFGTKRECRTLAVRSALEGAADLNHMMNRLESGRMTHGCGRPDFVLGAGAVPIAPRSYKIASIPLRLMTFSSASAAPSAAWRRAPIAKRRRLSG